MITIQSNIFNSLLSSLTILCVTTILHTGCTPGLNTSSPSVESEAVKQEPVSLPVLAKGEVSVYENLDSYKAMCGDRLLDMGPMLLEIAQMLEAKKFPYVADDTADCSGMFHRVLMNFQSNCPEQEIPGLMEYRDTRDLARWYHENDQLILVPRDSVLAYQGLIKPGAVLFYGYGGRTYTKFTAEDLFQRGTGINHVGVVVDVDYNDEGQIERYYLFHGRNENYTAGISNYHTRIPTRDNYPPLGNGPDQWVAFSTLTVDLR